MAGLKKRPLVTGPRAKPPIQPRRITSPMLKVRKSTRITRSPSSISNIKLNDSFNILNPIPPQSNPLPPPSSITPSSSRRRMSTRSSTSSSRLNQDIPSSPLTSKLESNAISKSSPVLRATRLNSLPSPSPDSATETSSSRRIQTRSSPIRSKRVMFTENLISKPTNIPTPKKSILKPTPSGPPQMNPLVPNNTHLDSTANASHLEFWTPGNIPRLPTPASSNEDIVFFKNIFLGGLIVLDMPYCDRQFEIYATLNFLFKDLNDKKIVILLGKINELLRVLKRDLVAIENEILNNESNPFLVRTDIQITKLLTQLLSSNKIVANFWKKTKTNFELAKWCINHSSSLILKPSISKSLLTANLQLIKDHKLHSHLSTQTQEFILYSLLNMKYFSSSSLLVERLFTLKSLIVNHTLMMEKNSRSWLPFLFNCLCDFNASAFQKQQHVAIQCLLEASKLYISSRNVNFEINRLLNSSIHKTLQIDHPSEDNTVNPSPLDLQQETFTYITNRIRELSSEQSKMAMDLWLGLTLLSYSDPDYIKAHPLKDSQWVSLAQNCLTHESPEVVANGIRAYKGLVYVLARNIRVMDSTKRDIQVVDPVQTNERLALIFSAFEMLNSQYKDDELIFSFALQVLYSLLNNSANKSIFDLVWSFIDKLFITLSARSEYLKNATFKIFSHLVYQNNQRQVDPFYLVKCVGNDKFNINELTSLDPTIIMESHSLIFGTFMSHIWNSKEPLKLKVHCLFGLMNGFKNINPKETDISNYKKVLEVIQCYDNFVNSYVEQLLNTFPTNDAMEYVNKFTLTVKASFGNKVFYKEVNDEIMPSECNIYVNIMRNAQSTTLRETDVLKFMVSHIKPYQYKFYESLVLSSTNATILHYLTNNFGSKIFEKSLPESDLKSIGFTISHLEKTPLLMKNYLSYIAKSSSVDPLQAIAYLCIGKWSATDIATCAKIIKNMFSSLKEPFTNHLSVVLQTMSSIVAIDLFNKLFSNNETDILSALTEHIYFHVIDMAEEHTPEVHIFGLSFFDKYLSKIKDNMGSEALDSFVVQGLELCEAVKNNGKDLSTVKEVEKMIKSVLMNLKSLDDFPKVDKFIKDRTSSQSPTTGPSILEFTNEIDVQTPIEAPKVHDEVSYAQSSESENPMSINMIIEKSKDGVKSSDIDAADIQKENTGDNKAAEEEHSQPEQPEQDQDGGENDTVEIECKTQDDIVMEDTTDEPSKEASNDGGSVELIDKSVAYEFQLESASPAGEPLQNESFPELQVQLQDREIPAAALESQDSQGKFKIGEFRKRVEVFKEKKRISKIFEELSKTGEQPQDTEGNNEEATHTANKTNPNELDHSGESIEDSDNSHNHLNHESKGYNDTLVIDNKEEGAADVGADEKMDFDNTTVDVSASLSQENDDVKKPEAPNQEQDEEEEVHTTNEGDDSTQIIEQTSSDPSKGIHVSGSVELTADWTDQPSDDHYFDARTNIVSSPNKAPASSPPASNADEEERFFESQDERASSESKAIDPINQVGETQEIPDSNEEPLPQRKAGETQEISDSNEGPAAETGENEKENEIPSDSMMLYSSPLKHVGSKSEPLRRIVNLSVEGTPTRSSKKRALMSGDNEGDEEEDDVFEIDDMEFTRSFTGYSSPWREHQVEQIAKKPRLEDSSPLDILTPPDDTPIMKPLDQINHALKGISDEDIAKLDDKEVFEIENRMLAFMMKLRARK